MIDVLYKLYAFTNESRLLEKIKIDAINRHLWRWTANNVMPIYYRLTSNNHKYKWPIQEIREQMTIGSLTSFPARIDKLWIVIESILHQDHQLDALFLWLSKEQFPSMDFVPLSLKRLTTRGLRIQLVDDDLRSHKKYYYVLKNYPLCNIFTFDDDIIYPTNAVSSSNGSKEETSDIASLEDIAIILKKMMMEQLDLMGNLTNHLSISNHGVRLLVGGGTFYPVGALPTIALDIFLKICKTADDVWLNLMCRFSGYRVVAIQKKCRLIEIRNKKSPTLTEINYGYENQKQINAVRDFCIKHGKDPFKELE